MTIDNQTLSLVSVLTTILLIMPVANLAYAQYMGNVGEEGETGSFTLEETLELAKRRIEAAEANPASGSGTPYLDADGVIGATIITGIIFGGIAGAFFYKGRSGRYQAQGRG